jgi:hypothetical protein
MYILLSINNAYVSKNWFYDFEYDFNSHVTNVLNGCFLLFGFVTAAHKTLSARSVVAGNRYSC